MLKNKYFTDVIETLLYANIKEWLMQSEVYDGSPIPLQEMCSGVEFDIANGSKQKKLEVLSVLKSHELENMIKNDTLKNANFTDFNKLLTDLINEFKKSIVWNK
jgi:radical SAM superfamily enzyme